MASYLIVGCEKTVLAIAKERIDKFVPFPHLPQGPPSVPRRSLDALASAKR
jgi:hypothetical protein